MKLALDTNILAYAEGVNGALMRKTAIELISKNRRCLPASSDVECELVKAGQYTEQLQEEVLSMNRILVCALLLLSAPLALNQQNHGRPPYTTPPTFPENRPQTHEPPLGVPPDQVPAASSDVQDQLQQILTKDPALKDAQVKTRVDDHTITLKGTVEDETQHQKVLQLAQTYAGQRKIVDNLVVKQKS